MKIINEYPPIYDAILSAGMHPNPSTIYAYGDAIYAPHVDPVPPDLIAHESAHCRQQGNDPDGWWSRYLDDPYFRIDQEAEAYAAQYDYVCQHMVKDRNARARFLQRLAGSLSSPIYGSVITQSSALEAIRNFIKTPR